MLWWCKKCVEVEPEFLRKYSKKTQKYFLYILLAMLNLVVSDMVKKYSFPKDVFDTIYQISNLVKESPERDQMLNKMRNDQAVSYPVFRVRYPTRWSMRAASLKRVLDNWMCLDSLWKECLLQYLDPHMRGRIIGVKTQMEKFNYFYCLKVLQLS